MSNSAKDILAKYERENKERAEIGYPYALKNSEGKFLRNRMTRSLIKRIENPILKAIMNGIMILAGIVLVVWSVFSIITYFQDF